MEKKNRKRTGEQREGSGKPTIQNSDRKLGIGHNPNPRFTKEDFGKIDPTSDEFVPLPHADF